MGDYFSGLLETLPYVREVRHQGLFVGIEFEDGVKGEDVKHECFERKLLITAIGSSIIRMVPPLIVTEEECDRAFGIIYDAVMALTRQAAQAS